MTIGHTSSAFNTSIALTRGSLPVSLASFFGQPSTCLRLLQPPLEILCGDATLITFLFLLSGLFTPGVELAVADTPGLDPREASLVLPAVDLEYRVVRLLQRPLLECTHRTAAGLTVERCAVAVLRADAACLGEVPPAVFAATHGDAALHAGLQRKADHIRHGVRVQHRRTSVTIQRYTHIKLKDKGLSTRVVRGIHTLLNNCLEQAVAERLILANPAKGCRLPKLEKREMKILPEDKIGPYLAEAERRGLLAAFYLELTTGLRRGELLALLWTDLDVENMTISVSKQVNRINGELVVSQPKTPNSIRKLAIPQRAVELLVEEHAKHPHSPHLFVSPKTGTMFDPDSFRHTHEKILKAIGAEHIRFHDLRHTFATERDGRCFPLLSRHFGFWVTVWVKRKTEKSCITFRQHKRKKFLISCEIRNFLVETAGLEPVTSCV